MQFASFKVKIQMEEVLFFRNRGEVGGVGWYGIRSPHTAYYTPAKRTPSRFCRIAKMKGDKMFRSNWENGERGTPEQWKFKPKTTYTTDLFILFYNSNLSESILSCLKPN